MSQRGGAVESHMRISENPIASDLISLGTADLIISVEPMESLRYLPFLTPKGWLITNTAPYINIPNYPDMEIVLGKIKSLEKHIALDADAIAKEIKAPRSSNIVMLGAASPFLCITFEKLKAGLHAIFERKGEDIVNQNIQALIAGREYAETHMK
jgi:indolepyruvate ferredoxin oxidoreductase beta subunit